MPLPPQPQPPHTALQFSRTNILDLKLQIEKQLGAGPAQLYFGYLNGFLLHKLSKVEFDKLCVQILGRGNLPLHNLLIRSILGNACQAKVPPLVNKVKGGVSRPNEVFLKKTHQIENAFKSSQTLDRAPQIFSNGDLLPPSPRKIRSGTLKRRIKDRLCPLGVDSKVEVASRQSFEGAVVKENGDLSLYDSKRHGWHQQSVPAEPLAKRPRVEEASLHSQGSLHIKRVVNVALKDRDHLEHQLYLDSAKGPIQAPLCIPRFSASNSGAQRSLLATVGSNSDSFSRYCNSGMLCHTDVLKKRMEKLAEAQGLEGVTLDCANLLNIGLDVYLKQLIRSGVDLVGARRSHERIKRPVSKPQPYMKPINGVWVDNHVQAQSSSWVSESSNELKSNFSVTMQDFKVAMELKPQQLGKRVALASRENMCPLI